MPIKYPPKVQMYIWTLRLIIPDAHKYDFNRLNKAMPESYESGWDVMLGIEKDRIYADIQIARHINESVDYFTAYLGEVVHVFYMAAADALLENNNGQPPS